MSARYRVAVIGDTRRGRYGHGLDTVWTQLPEAQIVGVADPDPQGRQAAQARLKTDRSFADYRQLLDQTRPQIVSIGPRWPDQHAEMVLAAAERGIHVYLEKPMCRTLEEADRMVAACERHQIKLAVAHQTRYSPRLQAVRELIEDGRLGRVLELRARGKEDRRGGGEDLWVLGSHVLNLMHHLGGDPNWCFAEVLQGGRRVTREHVAAGNEALGPLAGDSIQAVYGLPDGVTGFFASQREAGGGQRYGLRIYGTRGVLEMLTGYLPAVYFLDDPSWTTGRGRGAWRPVSSAGLDQPEPLTDTGLGGGNLLACRDLIGAIEQDRLPECSVYEGRTIVEMIAGVFESHRQGRPVSLPLSTRVNPLTLL